MTFTTTPNPEAAHGCLSVERRGDVVIARFTRELVLSGPAAEAAAERLTALLAEPGRGALLVDFGNVLRPAYFVVNPDIVWRIASEDLATLREALHFLRTQPSA